MRSTERYLPRLGLLVELSRSLPATVTNQNLGPSTARHHPPYISEVSGESHYHVYQSLLIDVSSNSSLRRLLLSRFRLTICWFDVKMGDRLLPSR
jgi:hypothetical protein